MQPNALLAWQNFVMQKVGVTNLPPVKGILPSRFRNIGKELWVICLKFFFMLLGSFIFGVVTPLYFTHLDDLTVSHSLCCIQNSDGPRHPGDDVEWRATLEQDGGVEVPIWAPG
jgi:hypothetical protein